MTAQRRVDPHSGRRLRWGLLALVAVPLFFWVGCRGKSPEEKPDADKEAQEERDDKDREAAEKPRPSRRALERRKEAALKEMSALNLQMLAVAMLQHAESFGGKLPPAVYIDFAKNQSYRAYMGGTGKMLAQLQAALPKGERLPLLSWRVAILPWLEQEKL
jgi:hypothetical protein